MTSRTIKGLGLFYVLLLTNWLPDNVVFLRFRGFLARPFFGSCGKNLRLGRNITFYNPSKLDIGSDVYIAYGNWFCAGGTITIEDEVMFGPSSIIVSCNHTIANDSYRWAPIQDKDIRIGRGSWVGGNCNILAGSEIGFGTVISAGSTTYKHVPDRVKYIDGIIVPNE